MGREVVIYGLGTFARRAASIIMLPIYTQLLTPADYGLLHLLDMTLDVAGIVLSAGVTAGVLRFYLKAETEDRRHQILGTAFALQLGLNLAGTLLLLALARPIWHIVLEEQGTALLVYVAAANFTIGVLSRVPLLYMQMERRALAYSVVSLSKVVMQLSLNILFLVVLGWGVIGILISTAATGCVVGGATLAWTLRSTRFSFSWEAVRDLRRFGVPIQIATAATFILTFGDRFFLQAFQGLTAVGLYGFAYQFGFVHQQIASEPFLTAWNPERFRLASEPRSFRDRKYNEGLRYFSLLVVTGAVGIAVFVRPLLEVMSNPSYWPAAALVPVVVAAYVMQSWGSVVTFGIEVAERTKYVTYTMWISVAVTLALYALLIPRFGPMGAAVATLVVFMLRSALLYYYSQRLWPISYEWGPPLRLLTIGTLATVAAFVIHAHGVIGKTLLGAGLLAGYAVLAWFAGIARAERAMIWKVLRKSPRNILGVLARS